MWKEFKEFISRGNVIDLAVAVIIGAAFSKIVDSLVEDMIMPVIGIIIGVVNFESLHFRIGGAVVSYGNFVQSMVDFLLISFTIFMIIKVFNKHHLKKSEKKLEKELSATDVELLTEIRDILKRKELMENNKKKNKSNETVIKLKAK
ncbi:large-conductance mechanosensitive channel protein MscL [Gracilibacillus sp. YIM 98692]|uniref:large-conductance mechanosensitive channel protein MscL n=1 Tax=Gracilibacillus sp. YIM 98692 TaxID=2663532 RepID=UPI0013D72247|nr:large-conductance mechanosensitive channel protein MscL [Gracilibacillus sp. YIM 98692]